MIKIKKNRGLNNKAKSNIVLILYLSFIFIIVILLLNIKDRQQITGYAVLGPNNPGTMADDASIGSRYWTVVDNAKTSDNNPAYCGSTDVICHYLKATNFGFNIPISATISGVKVEIERKANWNTQNQHVTDYSIKLVRNNIAYGKIDEKTLIELIEKRGELNPEHKKTKGKIDSKLIASKIIKNENLKDLEIKPFFRLHPPRKGINSKQHFPQGVLGDHKEKINDLIKRML